MNHAPEGLRLTRREWTLIVAFWLGYAALLVASRLFDRGAASQLSGLATTALLEAIVWIVLTPPIFALAARLDGPARRRTMVIVSVAGIVVAVGLGWAATELRQRTMADGGRRAGAVAARAVLGGGGQRPRPRVPRGPPIWFGALNALVLYSGTVAAGVARGYSHRYHLRREEAARREARLEAQLAEARLESLQRQLDPHFLFNTLNTVSALLERDPRGVRRMIARLSELLRHNLERGGEAEASLRIELEMLARYVEIMQVRFQGRLTVETDAPDDVLDAMVPSMILQTLVENAIRHGAERITAPAIIRITAERSGDDLVVRVRDNGPGLDGSNAAEAGHGVGLSNSRARLEQLYGTSQGLTLSTHREGGADVELRVPFHMQPMRVSDAG